MLKKVYTHTGQRTGQFLKQTHIHFAVVTSSKNSVTVTCISFFLTKLIVHLIVTHTMIFTIDIVHVSFTTADLIELKSFFFEKKLENLKKQL